MNSDLRPVYLDSDKCKGCVACMRRCPTEAIRVRNGKATIMYERCIGCGECVKVCPSHAKKENFDDFSIINSFKYKVCLVSPSTYGQFKNLTDINFLLTGIKNLGFDDVLEVGVGAEYVSAATAEYIKTEYSKNNSMKFPIISSSCPAVVNLIRMRYEHLLEHLSPLQQPEEVTANLARAKAEMETNFSGDEIGIFVLTQCAAQFLQLKTSVNAKIDGVLSFKQVYFRLLEEMNKIKKPLDLTMVGKIGISWGSSTGEAMGLETDNFISCEGMENVISVLNDLEHDKLNDIYFLELYACTSGCVGGSLNMESPFIARTRLRKLRNLVEDKSVIVDDYKPYLRKEPYKSNNVFKLDDNLIVAMRKMLKVKQIYASLPQIDCGSCGAPNCMALAEDIVKGLDVRCKYREASGENSTNK